MTVDSTMQYN